ncbi:MAG: GNAT family N-acetyltransferase [Bacteroidota bacterium]
MRLQRYTFPTPAFKELVRQLDEYLAITDGDEHDFYDQYNGLEDIHHIVVAFEGEIAVACGAFKKFEEATKSAEIKRMFTHPDCRGKGLASQVLRELENWAVEEGFDYLMLETGKRQPEAIALYEKNGYQRIPNYGQYAQMENSCCFGKSIG